jgi:hypothetical protein
MPILGLTNSYRVGQSKNSPLASFGALIEKIIEAIKRRFFDKSSPTPEMGKRCTILEKATAILTADPTSGIWWEDELEARKTEVLQLLKKYNATAKKKGNPLAAIDPVEKISAAYYPNHSRMVQSVQRVIKAEERSVNPFPNIQVSSLPIHPSDLIND